MKKITPVLLAVALLGLLPMAVTAGESATAKESAVDMEAAKVTFENTCSKCHGIDRPLGKKKDRAGWESTVSRMSGYHQRFGAPISDQDQKAIVEYLLQNAGK